MRATFEQLLEAEYVGKQPGDIAFRRSEIRHRRLKVRGSCGHMIDGSRVRITPYRYTVWKVVGEKDLRQLIECEACAFSGGER